MQQYSYVGQVENIFYLPNIVTPVIVLSTIYGKVEPYDVFNNGLVVLPEQSVQDIFSDIDSSLIALSVSGNTSNLRLGDIFTIGIQ